MTPLEQLIYPASVIMAVVLTALYWVKKNRELIIWEKKLAEYKKIVQAFDKVLYVLNATLLENKDAISDERLKTVTEAFEQLRMTICIGSLIISPNIIIIIKPQNELWHKMRGEGEKLDLKNEYACTQSLLNRFIEAGKKDLGIR